MLKFTSLVSVLIYVLVFLPLFHGGIAFGAGTADGSEEWGYVQVRPKANMFWWYYKSPNRAANPSKPWPIILWLQGGPGSSGVAVGNFQEIGPLDINLKPRKSTWLQLADLLFVDNPVGTGFSYVEDTALLVKTDEEAATDLTTLLKELFNKNENLQKSPLFIIAESYGGKFAVTVGLSVVKAIEARELKLQLGGVALGDSWISPEDYVFSWGPLLKDLSRIDNNALQKCNSMAQQIKQQLENGSYESATSTWQELEGVIMESSNKVDFYNFLLDYANDNVGTTTTTTTSKLLTAVSLKRYSTYLTSKKISANGQVDINGFMKKLAKTKLKIIPQGIKWGAQSDLVFDTFASDFMKPRINEVGELLAKGVNVTVYNGQVDLICATKGTEAWIQKLKWDGLQSFLSLNRTALYCGVDTTTTKGFTKSYKNLHFYWILLAGHYVPVDQPCIALKMVGDITHSPIASAQ